MIKLDVEIIIEDPDDKICYSEKGPYMAYNSPCRFLVPRQGCGGITFGYKRGIFQKNIGNNFARLVECINSERKIKPLGMNAMSGQKWVAAPPFSVFWRREKE